ncbi:hypothetical protein [Tannockella kyphosi]|uniref:hypothetical protein n=1 Tax=Tannockella kyphosi TaxID=2899121 RepID=UPI002011A506|nr:hypothetical protein [Tannockella kyphosi]
MKKGMLFVLLILLTGCTEDYDKKDIKNAVEEKLNLTDITVSSTSYIRIEEDGYEDSVWTVTVDDTGLVFHVIDDFYWGNEWVSNSLWNDYNAAVIDFIYDDLPVLERLEVVSSIDEEGLFSANIQGSYTNKEELLACYNDIQILQSTFEQLGYEGLSIGYYLTYDHLLANTIETYDDTSGNISGMTSYETSYEEMLAEFIQCALDYRYEVIETFTQEEIATALDGYYHRVYIYYGEQEDEDDYEEEFIVCYDDIVGSTYGYGISFSSLYEILVREGYPVEGDAGYYSFIGIDGSEYVISYDFDDYDYGDKIGYYYLKDGEKIAMGACFYNHFYEFKIEEMTGLKLIEGREVVE